TKMRIARCRLRPGVADADHRPAVELIARNTLILHPRPVDKCIAVVTGEPNLRAQRALLLRGCGLAHQGDRRAPVASSNTWTSPGPRCNGQRTPSATST